MNFEKNPWFFAVKFSAGTPNTMDSDSFEILYEFIGRGSLKFTDHFSNPFFSFPRLICYFFFVSIDSATTYKCQGLEQTPRNCPVPINSLTKSTVHCSKRLGKFYCVYWHLSELNVFPANHGFSHFDRIAETSSFQ